MSSASLRVVFKRNLCLGFTTTNMRTAQFCISITLKASMESPHIRQLCDIKERKCAKYRNAESETSDFSFNIVPLNLSHSLWTRLLQLRFESRVKPKNLHSLHMQYRLLTHVRMNSEISTLINFNFGFRDIQQGQVQVLKALRNKYIPITFDLGNIGFIQNITWPAYFVIWI